MIKHEDIRFEVVSRGLLSDSIANWGHKDKDFVIDPLQLCFVLERIATENKVRRILLIFRVRHLPVATAYEIAVSLNKCQQRGINLTAYSDHLSLAILLAMAPCKIRVCPPLAGPLKIAFPIEHVSVSHILPKLGLTVQVARSSKFKVGAVDFSNNGIPREVLEWEENISRENLHFVLQVISQHIGTTLDSNPNLYSTAVEAVEVGLLTHVAYEQLLDRIDNPLVSVPWRKAVANVGVDRGIAAGFRWRKSKLALINLDIQNSLIWNSIQASRMVSTISSLFNRLDIKGVLLVIDFQGGDLSDADRIWCMLMELRKQIPIVAYIRNALSAGYHVASAATQIVANPLALLGAIGTVAGRLDASLLLKNLDIDANVVGINQAGPSNRLLQPIQNNEPHELQTRVEIGAKLFESRVATGRNLQIDHLSRISNGRVFSALEAIQYQLADHLGTPTTSAELLMRMVNPAKELPFVLLSGTQTSLIQRLSDISNQLFTWLSE